MAKKIPCEVYSRVVGYFRPLTNWNDGKRQEHREKVYYVIKGANYYEKRKQN